MDNFIDLIKEPEVIWFFVGLALLIIELFGLSLIIGFFGIGAWVTAILLMFLDLKFTTQFIIFISASLAGLLLLRKFIKNAFFDGRLAGEADNKELQDEFIGQKVIVEHAITPKKPGKVSFKGSLWTALSDENLESGEMVEIVAVNSIQLTVKSL